MKLVPIWMTLALLLTVGCGEGWRQVDLSPLMVDDPRIADVPPASQPTPGDGGVANFLDPLWPPTDWPTPVWMAIAAMVALASLRRRLIEPQATPSRTKEVSG